MIKELIGIQLQDSFVLSWGMNRDSLVFDVEFSLWPEHPQYQTPKPNEWTCYQRGKLLFEGVSSQQGLLSIDNVRSSTDASGELDYGNIDELEEINDGEFRICGDFGVAHIFCRQLKIEIEAQPDA